MKSLALSFVTALSVLFLCASTASAQVVYGPEPYYNPRAPHRPLPGTLIGRGGYAVSNHSISAQVLGLEYSFEGALASNFTLIARAGVVPTGIAFSSGILNSTYAHFNVGLGLTLEPRIYTSFDRRARLGRSTYMNSSDFVSFRTQAIWAADGVCFAFTPLYGIRRTTGDHWAHEFTFGPRFAWAGEEDLTISPHIQYRLVFMF
jgi:hypothetical protein